MTDPNQVQAKKWVAKTPLNTTRVEDQDGPQGKINNLDDKTPNFIENEGLYSGRYPEGKTILARNTFPGSEFTSAIYASATIDPTGTNNTIIYTAKNAGAAGNSITVAYAVAGLNTALSVAVVGNAITVNVATDGAGAATSTALDVQIAVSGSVGASALVSAETSGLSTGVVAAVNATNLAGGVDEIITPINR